MKAVSRHPGTIRLSHGGSPFSAGRNPLTVHDSVGASTVLAPMQTVVKPSHFHLSLSPRQGLLAAVMALGIISPLAMSTAQAAQTAPAPIEQAVASHGDEEATSKFVTLTLNPSNGMKDSTISVNPDHVVAVMKPTSGNGAVVEMEDNTKYAVTESYAQTVKAFPGFVSFKLGPSNAMNDTEIYVNPAHVSGILKPLSGTGSVLEMEDSSKYAVTESYADAVKPFPKFIHFSLAPSSGFLDSEISVNPDLVADVMKPTLRSGSVLELTDGSKYPVLMDYAQTIKSLD